MVALDSLIFELVNDPNGQHPMAFPTTGLNRILPLPMVIAN
jgi:hypothetical protein